jgi:hypothetical protein
LEVLSEEYHLLCSSCIDVPSVTLESLGLDPGYSYEPYYDPVSGTGKSNIRLPDAPNKRFKQIMNNNPGGTLIKISPSNNVKRYYKNHSNQATRQRVRKLQRQQMIRGNRLYQAMGRYLQQLQSVIRRGRF